jgi:hypothetical protein
MIDDDNGRIYVSLACLPPRVLDRLATEPGGGIKTRVYPQHQHVHHLERGNFVEIDRAIAATEDVETSRVLRAQKADLRASAPAVGLPVEAAKEATETAPRRGNRLFRPDRRRRENTVKTSVSREIAIAAYPLRSGVNEAETSRRITPEVV